MQCHGEPSLTELLNEPIVQQLMARDGTSERQVRAIAILARRRIEQQRRRAPAADRASASSGTGHALTHQG
jgi:hypothetical protein